MGAYYQQDPAAFKKSNSQMKIKPPNRANEFKNMSPALLQAMLTSGSIGESKGIIKEQTFEQTNDSLFPDIHKAHASDFIN